MSKAKCLWLFLGFCMLIGSANSVFAKPIEIHWWHAMRGARGEDGTKDCRQL